MPIVKFTDRETGISIDISAHGTDGIRAVKMIREMKEKYPEFLHLVVVLKA